MMPCLALMLLQGHVHAGTHRSLANSDAKGKGNSMIAKVIEMLGEEKEKIKKNVAAEGVAMAEYTQWCDDTQTEKSYAIKSAKAKIEDLTATITDATAELHSLDAEITSLGDEIAERHTEIEEADAQRAKDHEQYLKAEAEQMAMVEELEALEVALKKQMAAATTPPPVTEEAAEPAADGEASLIQSPAAKFDALLLQLRTVKKNLNKVDTHDSKNSKNAKKSKNSENSLARLLKGMSRMVTSVWVDPESNKNLALLKKHAALLQQDPEEEPAEEPAAEEGEPEGESDQLAAFEGLKGKAEEALQKARDEEVKKQSEHDMNIASLKTAVALAENKLEDAQKDKARISQEKHEAEGEMTETEASKAADEETLATVTKDCESAASAWATRQSEATAESAALDKAKEILASRVTVFLQVAQPAQSGGTPSQSPQAKLRTKLVTHFRTLGNKLHSLAMLNLVSVSAQDPMANVKGLLKELIAKLEKEAADTANLHAFCQAEKEKTSAAIEKKTMTLDKLNSRISKATAKKTELGESIAELSGELADISKMNEEATKTRDEQHTTFMKVETDFTEASDAVDDAISALQEYYGVSLLQTKNKDAANSDVPAPALGGAKHDSAGGIISILETIGEDFRKTLKEARSDEREAQHAFDSLMHDNKVASAAKEAEIKASQSEIMSLTTSIGELGGDAKMTTKELDAVNDYVAKLKPQCEGRTVPYAERKAKRDAEIAGLKEGLAILAADGQAGSFNFLQIQAHH